MSLLAAQKVAKTIKNEPFDVQKDILSSIQSIEIQRIVFNQLIIVSFKQFSDYLAVFYVNHNEYYIAQHWAYSSSDSPVVPSPYLMLVACLGPAFIEYPHDDKLKLKVAQCKLNKWKYFFLT